MTVNCSDYLHRRHEAGDEILFEGAQGTHIDIDHGNYPFVTSSNPTAGAASVGSGLGVTTVGDGEVVGIVKAYLSRVGEGPLPTELDGDADEEALADDIREKGGEFGTVTGRPAESAGSTSRCSGTPRASPGHGRRGQPRRRARRARRSEGVYGLPA